MGPLFGLAAYKVVRQQTLNFWVLGRAAIKTGSPFLFFVRDGGAENLGCASRVQRHNPAELLADQGATCRSAWP